MAAYSVTINAAGNDAAVATNAVGVVIGTMLLSVHAAGATAGTGGAVLSRTGFDGMPLTVGVVVRQPE